MKRKTKNKIKRLVFYIGIFLSGSIGSCISIIHNSIVENSVNDLMVVPPIMGLIFIIVAKIIYYLFCIFKK
jgi:hypothetical protein